MQAQGLSQTSNFTWDNPACTLTNANGQKKSIVLGHYHMVRRMFSWT